MSDTYVQNQQEFAITNNEINSKNFNKNAELNNNEKDEVIEEFNFSDSDLLDDNNDNKDHVCALTANSISTTTTALDNNCEHFQDNHTKSTDMKVDAFSKEQNLSQSNYKFEPTISNDKLKNIPKNLELNEETLAEVAVDSFCPITPREIVDVGEKESDSFTQSNLMKSGSCASVGRIKTTCDKSNENDKNADDDLCDEYDIDPDEELLVQFLGEANDITEARLAARRQARAEAREIRMRELERQQKEQEQNADRIYDMHTASGIDPVSRSRLTSGIGASPMSLLNSTRGNSMSSRRSSEDSLEEEGRSLRDIRHELKDVEERFRKAMIANAQLDNERASQTYQIQLLKDKLEEVEESYAQLQREFKDKSRDYNTLKRNLEKLTEELRLVEGQLNERDTLIAEQGLVIVAVENDDGTDAKRALVSAENAQLLGSVQGSLDVRLKKFSEEKQQLISEVQQLQEQLEVYKSQGKGRGSSANGPLGSEDDYEAQREANKIISDCKYKLQKAEQEIASLQASLARSETQVIRYKSTAEAAEKAEAELKIERRKLQREDYLIVNYWDECHCQ
ncbi:leucine-rich repeat flightless-interacting protein 2 isoform X2 [Teleopsis dalmanni]|uniref:leucine-rich repeat flightless-interacting protein 2 isoform X2 n=1 Tax=Teleopsis dalmanni TaxID=139649 RepID=UPI0018CE63DD|nr:leucine-rich repeat flightless-interacting protein 2 isoform X2 [Teleopsis dalmanni]